MYRIKHTATRPSRVERLLASMPPDVADSFSTEQLESLDRAIAASRWQEQSHPLDLRFTVKLWRYRYYLVLLGGRNRRELSRLQYQFGRLWLALAIVFFMSLCMLVGLAGLYVIKSALGIDIFGSFSLGFWGA